MTHPLTEEIIEKIAANIRHYDYSSPIIFKCDMQTAADWQLDQDQKKLEDFLEEFSYRGHSADAILELRAFVNNFKSYMRPQGNN
jgi:hypothetical protein